MRQFETRVSAAAPKRAAAPRRPAAQPTRPTTAQLGARLAVLQRRATGAADPARRNETGLPDRIKTGVEALSGLSLDDVRVHYGSSRPAQLQAHAYTVGTEIHVAPGQERHIAHEAWHVVQQKQGRVKPTIQYFGVPVNDDSGLEGEADHFGSLAAAWRGPPAEAVQRKAATSVVQRAAVSASYTVSLGKDFYNNHIRTSKAAANSRSEKRRLNTSTIINGKSANVKTTVEQSEETNWSQPGNDERRYQSFDLPHWMTYYYAEAPHYRTEDEQTSAVWLGARFDSKASTCKVTHLTS